MSELNEIYIPEMGKIEYDFFFYDFKGELNNGGVEIALKTEYGNIYLRKAKP